MDVTRRTRRVFPASIRPGRAEAIVGLLIVAELLAVVAHVRYHAPIVTSPLAVTIPFVWINLGVWAVLRVGRPPRGRRTVAALIATGYVGVLLVAAGTISSGGGHHGGVSVYWLSPGWGPLVTVQSAFLDVSIVPYQVIGYLTLGYLVFTTVARRVAGALTGVFAAFSCVGCTAPLLVAAIGAVGGTVSSSIAAVGSTSALGTGVYAATVLLLVFAERLQPGADG